jgi:hypothetical protein
VNDRRSARRDEESDDRRAAAAPLERRERPEAASILELQASAGNRAVAELMGSHQDDAGRQELQRDPADDASRAEPANEGNATATATMAIPDLELSIPLLSFSRQVTGPGRSDESSGEVVVTFAISKLDPRVTKAVTIGRRFKVITIVIGPQTITLHDVLFSSVNIGPDTVALGLNFASMEHHVSGTESGWTDDELAGRRG